MHTDYTVSVHDHSRNIDRYCRSWIEYLNQRLNICILDMSIKVDTSCIHIISS